MLAVTISRCLLMLTFGIGIKCRHQFCWRCSASYEDIRRDGNIVHTTGCPYHSGNLIDPHDIRSLQNISNSLIQAISRSRECPDIRQQAIGFAQRAIENIQRVPQNLFTTRTLRACYHARRILLGQMTQIAQARQHICEPIRGQRMPPSSRLH